MRRIDLSDLTLYLREETSKRSGKTRTTKLGEKVYPLIGRSRADIEVEFGEPAVAIDTKPNGLIASYDNPKPGAVYTLYVQFLSGIAHEIGITLRNGVPFPDEFVRYWLDRNADISESAHPWRPAPSPPVEVRFWVRKDDAFTFVSAEYKVEGTDYRMRFKTERLYD